MPDSPRKFISGWNLGARNGTPLTNSSESKSKIERMNLKYQGALSGLILVSGLLAADTKIPFSELPPAVQNAAKAQTRGAQVVGANSEKENGRTIYEVETKVNGKSRDLNFDVDGKLLEIEQEVGIDTIPPAAKDALVKKAGSGTIQKVESITQGDAVSYEASIKTKSGKHTEFAVKADGAPAGH